MISVLCVRFGSKYGPEYVEKLRNMVSRHLTEPYKFYCLTDDSKPIDGVISIVQPNRGFARPWWHKVYMFDPSLNLEGRILYFDLDVVIHGNLDVLVKGYSKEFLGIKDFNRRFHPSWNMLNSSVMSWPSGTNNDIFEQFQKNFQKAQQLHGDQDWIWQLAKERITFWPTNYIMSYKWEIRDRDEIDFGTPRRLFKTIRNPDIPEHCAVSVFHGEPKPEDVRDPFIVDNWR